VTLSEIEPATSRLAAQCLNQLRNRVSPTLTYCFDIRVSCHYFHIYYFHFYYFYYIQYRYMFRPFLLTIIRRVHHIKHKCVCQCSYIKHNKCYARCLIYLPYLFESLHKGAMFTKSTQNVQSNTISMAMLLHYMFRQQLSSSGEYPSEH
jgi:hypothetical protein